MEPIRKPFQGVWNIVRFNWHFYLLSAALALVIYLSGSYLNNPYAVFGNIVCCMLVTVTIVSLFVSFYVYDLSGLYKLNWLNELSINPNSTIVNINAGFDESSLLLRHKFPHTELLVYDFYNPLIHTEISIKRARTAYPPFPNTKLVDPSSLPLQNNCADNVFVILSAHEIRNQEDRDIFFAELKRILKRTGRIIIIEHLRDTPNFLAYNIGFFHFIAKSSWYRTFKNAGLRVRKEIKITPFLTTFILESDGSKS
jgi:ubiquinone/menaquinone biosynthesis C-methylase UbiE